MLPASLLIHGIDPWSTINRPLPQTASLEELRDLRDTAAYCADQAQFLREAAQTGSYADLGFPSAGGCPELDEDFEDDYHTALDRYEELKRRIDTFENASV